MGAIKGLVKVVSWSILVLAVGWTLAILGTAKVLGNAALVAETDAYVALALNALAVPALLVLIVSAWRGKRRLKRYAAAGAASYMPAQPGQYPGYGWPTSS